MAYPLYVMREGDAVAHLTTALGKTLCNRGLVMTRTARPAPEMADRCCEHCLAKLPAGMSLADVLPKPPTVSMFADYGDDA